MLFKIVSIIILVAATVGIHTWGCVKLIHTLMKHSQSNSESNQRNLFLRLIGVTLWLLVLHLAEIVVWGLYYYWQDCFPDASSALYFSGVTYTTVGYGDLVLPELWQIFAPAEALVGILMGGLSTGLFFSILSHWSAIGQERKLQAK